MVWEKLKNELILTNLDVQDACDVFDIMGGKLVSLGYCKDSYVDALKIREVQFPTGINLGDYGVAIPHTEAHHVNDEAIAIGTLTKPVRFVEMGTDDDYVDTQLIFMLAVDEKGHIDLLQAIIDIIQDAVVVDKIIQSQSAKEIIEIIKEKEKKS